MLVEDQSEVIRFLSEPGILSPGGNEIDRVETHISVVLMTADRAFKLKRAVKFPYLDFSTRDRRRHFCKAEVRINRRTAPDVYRRVVAVTREADGSLALDGEGEPIEWLVEMERFDEATLFDRLAQKGALDCLLIEDLADTIARFHSDAERCDDSGGRAAMAAIVENNNRCFNETPSSILDAVTVQALTTGTWRALDDCADVLDQRRHAGFVRHCHGDLHLRNIFLHRGRPTLFDAIEFSRAFSDIDVLYDLAFLLMDLEFRDLRALAAILFNRYLDSTGDAGGLGALPLFLSVRAAIRSHVDAAAAISHSDPGEAGLLKSDSRRYLDLALAYLTRPQPRLVAIGGLSGTGKSRLARDIAPALGAAPGARVVRTDCMRKRIAGVALGTRLTQESYTPEMNRRTYEAVFNEVKTALAAGHSVIADAVFARSEERDAIAQVASEAGVPFQGLWLEAQQAVMEERVAKRKQNVSDATVEVVRSQLAYDLGSIGWRRLDSSGDKERTLTEGLRLLGLK